MELSFFTILLIVFVLACVVGYFVVWGVTPALHTPLMAVTNAISGIVVVAAITVAGFMHAPETVCQALLCEDVSAVAADIQWGKVIGFVAITLASINIFGGFAITRRMLAMFKKKGE